MGWLLFGAVILVVGGLMARAVGQSGGNAVVAFIVILLLVAFGIPAMIFMTGGG